MPIIKCDRCEQPNRVSAGTKPVCSSCGDKLAVPIAAWTAEPPPVDHLAEIAATLHRQQQTTRFIYERLGWMFKAWIVSAVLAALYAFAMLVSR